MARHVIRAVDGFVDMYAIIPDNATVDSSEEDDGAEEQHFGEQQYSEEHHDINQYQVYEEQHLQDHHFEENQHVQEQQEDMHVQHPEMHEHHPEIQEQQDEQLEDGQLIDQLDHQIHEQIQPNAAKKLTVVRAARQVLDKGKGIQDVSAHDDVLQEDIEDDSDYEDVHEKDSEDSSVDDEEAICYRKQTLELKKIVKIRMLGEVEDKGTKVPEEFIVPEEIEEEAEDGSDFFDTEDELSYDEDSDGNVITRKTKHRVYDESSEDCTAQLKEKHVLYFEKQPRSRKQAPAQQQPTSMHQHPAGQQPTAIHQAPTQQKQAPAHRPFVPPKKKQAEASAAMGHSSSQPSTESSSQTGSSMHNPTIRRRQTIPMSEVVTEQVPKHGRLKWFMLGNNKTGQEGAQDPDA
ncbi:hypothetical protein ACQ4PT_041148 [Festuca glaucescens]